MPTKREYEARIYETIVKYDYSINAEMENIKENPLMLEGRIPSVKNKIFSERSLENSLSGQRSFYRTMDDKYDIIKIRQGLLNRWGFDNEFIVYATIKYKKGSAKALLQKDFLQSYPKKMTIMEKEYYYGKRILKILNETNATTTEIFKCDPRFKDETAIENQINSIKQKELLIPEEELTSHAEMLLRRDYKKQYVWREVKTSKIVPVRQKYQDAMNVMKKKYEVDVSKATFDFAKAKNGTSG